MTLFDSAPTLTATLVFRLAVVAVSLGLWRQPRAACRVAFIGSTLASAATAWQAFGVLRSGTGIDGVLYLHDASGFALSYAIDGLSAWFLLVLSLLAIPIAIYSLGYTGLAHLGPRSAFFGSAFNLLTGAVELVFSSGDALTFLVGWELMTFSTAALVATEHEQRDARRAAYLYLAMSHLATGCLIGGFMVLASYAGSFSFATMLSGELVPGAARTGLFVLFFVGFGVKAGVIPLHVWLPEAHPAAPSSISALMSGVLIKTGIYGIIRVCALGLGVPSLWWGVFVIGVGGASALLGVLYALMQHDLKRLLAYHSIENIGIILLGLGAGMVGLTSGRPDVAVLGFTASLYHVLNHAVFKVLLFLGAGGVVVATGTRQIEAFGGLIRRMPRTGLCFLVGAMAISGLPPLNGFASEWLTFQAFLFGFRGSTVPMVTLLFPIGGALLALTTALAAACFVKAFGITFLALPRSRQAAEAVESPAVMLVPQAALAALCLALGLFPGVVTRIIGSIVASRPGFHPAANIAGGVFSIAPGVLLFDHVVPGVLFIALLTGVGLTVALTVRRRAPVRHVATWGCGGQLTASTEYTATAFSKPLMMIFAAIYRPTRKVESLSVVSPYFPSEVHYHSEIEPTFERFVYRPLLAAVLRVAEGLKRLQAGSLHAYLSYVIALVVTLVLMVWWRS